MAFVCKPVDVPYTYELTRGFPPWRWTTLIEHGSGREGLEFSWLVGERWPIALTVVAELMDEVSDTFLPSRRIWDGREPSTDRFLDSNLVLSRSSSGLVIEPVDESASSVKESISESVAPIVSEL